MTPAFEARWRATNRPWQVVFVALATLFSVLLVAPGIARADEATASVIIREMPTAGDEAETLVTALGGTVGDRLEIIDAFEAELTTAAVAKVRALPTVLTVTPNAAVRLLSWDTSPGQTRNTMDRIANDVVEADKFWNDGATGQGIDIALIDSGVLPVEGLTLDGKVVNGPDLSFESQAENLRYLDTYGHGTHLAGIMAGNDGHDSRITTKSVHGGFLGIAPESRVVSLKVADAMGNTDVSQVIAAIDWVVQHRNDNGMNIRVLNLSFGTDSTQDYRLDPLSYAAEVAWKHGIVVVVAAGNDGNASPLRNPATNPFVISVGAIDGNGSGRTNDDWLPQFSSCGTATRPVDVLAPGKSIVSLRALGSAADVDFPKARYDDRFFKGSGTSQAAAVVSGAAALLLSQRPGLTPDQVKKILVDTSESVWWIANECHGAGLVDLGAATNAATPSNATQTHDSSTGTGSLEASRGSMHVYMDGVPLTGEQDIFGQAWDGLTWSGLSWSGLSWSSGMWNGTTWSGLSWSGLSWSGLSWSGVTWSGLSWSGLSWSSAIWSSNTWDGLSWSGLSWSGLSWSGSTWSSTGWLGLSWK